MQSAYVCVLCTGGGFSYAPRGVERWECVQWVAEGPEVPEGSQVSFDGGWSKAFGTKKATKSSCKKCHLLLGDGETGERESCGKGLVVLPACSVKERDSYFNWDSL